MSQPHLPDNFNTQLTRGGVLQVTIKNGRKNELIASYEMRWLADKLLCGEFCTKAERAIAGAAIGHLLGLQKAKRAP